MDRVNGLQDRYSLGKVLYEMTTGFWFGSCGTANEQGEKMQNN